MLHGGDESPTSHGFSAILHILGGLWDYFQSKEHIGFASETRILACFGKGSTSVSTGLCVWYKTGGRLRAIGSTIKRNGSLSKTAKQTENQTDKRTRYL